MTIEQLLKKNPCWPEYKIRRIAGGKKEWNALEVLDLEIPAKDKLWVVLRKELIEEYDLSMIAYLIADYAIDAARDANADDADDAARDANTAIAIDYGAARAANAADYAAARAAIAVSYAVDYGVARAASNVDYATARAAVKDEIVQIIREYLIRKTTNETL